MLTGKFPHTQEGFIKHGLFLFYILTEILFPVEQSFIVMQTQIFNVQSVEIVLCHMIQDFSQTGNSSAWKDIFLDPWITRMFFSALIK